MIIIHMISLAKQIFCLQLIVLQFTVKEIKISAQLHKWHYHEALYSCKRSVKAFILCQLHHYIPLDLTGMELHIFPQICTNVCHFITPNRSPYPDHVSFYQSSDLNHKYCLPSGKKQTWKFFWPAQELVQTMITNMYRTASSSSLYYTSCC